MNIFFSNDGNLMVRFIPVLLNFFFSFSSIFSIVAGTVSML